MLENGFSPTELLYSQKLRYNVIWIHQNLKPKTFLEGLASSEERYRKEYKDKFDRQRGCKELSHLIPGDLVWITDRRRHVQVTRVLKSPKLYQAKTTKNIVRRN